MFWAWVVILFRPKAVKELRNPKIPDLTRGLFVFRRQSSNRLSHHSPKEERRWRRSLAKILEFVGFFVCVFLCCGARERV